ncbi:GH1 family beta-glucosidase [Phytoactinopolyspora mesophila]|uniref:Beta-glucosidase n=1 Tax=Phytoactinopolyspora mesophila TaxID=2650750 RepID=A0A7K3LXZ3_9ACTN|nr:GH1 family beta-glucosidase [Phytoactinopolyspora mesophila]NDL55522.1 beta-glucosidase [Phytoactinopolyspora mesophila]
MTIDKPAPRPRATSSIEFPAGFRWGAATAAYQIEGAVAEGGRAPSIWDTFSRVPGAIADGSTGDVACDHYHRFRDDVRLMADLGLTSYRFSIAWPRVQPPGKGPANQDGLDFYRHLVDELLANDIEPWATLYHWDLPQPLEDAGGWPERETAARFADYASLVHGALGDRIRNWTTLNEPWCSAFLGYGSGEHAPGRRDGTAAVRAAHHLLLGHGLATQAIRADDASADVGITVNLYGVSATGSRATDLDAARRIDGMANRIFLDPLLRGEYPADVLEDLGPVSDFSHVHDGDMPTIATPMSYLGVNYYSRYFVAGPPDGDTSASPPSDWSGAWPGSEFVQFSTPDQPVTGMGWAIDADGLAEILVRLHRDYTSLPIYVMENGAAYDDVVDDDGQISDPERLAYIKAHLGGCHEAITSGVPVQGYFVWSLMDNFEWGYGYSKRFGIVHVDYADQRRTPKKSAQWYADAISRNGFDA